MSQPDAPQFLDAALLLERSQPRPRQGWLWYGLGCFLLVVMLMTYLSSKSPLMESLVRLLSIVAMVAVIAAMGGITWLAVRKQRGEMQQVQAIEELVRLRRWPQAALVLEDLLSRPTRTPNTRIHGLIYLTAVLSRYHRFEDAIAVQQYLLDHVNLDPSTAHAMRLGRAMAMLRQDHLVDADRAISELRRQTQGKESAGLALIQMYRDVKTGHPQEAIDIFNQSLPAMRQQLGSRVGDAWALAAKAYDMLARDAEARQAYERATLLSPLIELHRRYPELQSLAQKYHPVEAPPEVMT